MKTMHTFNFSRLLQVMKWDILGNKKRILSQFFLLYGAFVVINLSLLGGFSSNYDPKAFEQFVFILFGFSAFVSTWCLLASASMMNEIQNTKEKRTAYLMLPATHAEKFVSRALQVTVGMILALFVAWILADITRLLLTPLFDVPESYRQLSLPYIGKISELRINTPAIVDASSFLFYSMAITIHLWIHSLFILGGSYFYKKPFAKTFAIVLVTFLLLATILPYTPINSLKSVPDTVFCTVNLLIFLTLTVFNWIGSYRLFTCSQITERHLLTSLFKRS